MKYYSYEVKDLQKRFLEIKPDYDLGTNYIGEGREIYSIERNNETGRVTMMIEETHQKANYALSSRFVEKHPKLTKEQFEYIVGKRLD